MEQSVFLIWFLFPIPHTSAFSHLTHRPMYLHIKFLSRQIWKKMKLLNLDVSQTQRLITSAHTNNPPPPPHPPPLISSNLLVQPIMIRWGEGLGETHFAAFLSKSPLAVKESLYSSSPVHSNPCMWPHWCAPGCDRCQRRSRHSAAPRLSRSRSDKDGGTQLLQTGGVQTRC